MAQVVSKAVLSVKMLIVIGITQNRADFIRSLAHDEPLVVHIIGHVTAAFSIRGFPGRFLKGHGLKSDIAITAQSRE